MTGNYQSFSTFSVFLKHVNISLADGRYAPTYGKGNVQLTHDLTLEDVLLVPTFPTILLSVHKLCTQRKCQVISILFNVHFMNWMESRKQIGHGFNRGKLYYFPIKQQAVTNVVGVSSMPNAMQWLSRLGHPHLNKLKVLVPNLGNVSHFNCETCQLSKHRSESSPSQSLSKSSQPFDLAHSDVWGPLNAPNVRKFRYYVIFVDDHSRMSWLYLLKDRSEVFSCFKKFVNEIKTQFEAMIKIFRSDNALEYMSTVFQKCCNDLGMNHT